MFNLEKKSLVSVIIPTYNRGWILHEAIDSALNQKAFDDFEVIIVDDGSTDNTKRILQAYNNKIKVLHQYNLGVSAARNKGVAVASGKWIAFLDSDDLWKPKKLITQVEFFSSNPEALICQTEEIWIQNGVRINPKKRHKKPSGDIFEPSLRLCLVSPSAVMIKKDFFELIGGFDETLPACEDYDLWLRIGCRYPVFLIDDPLVVKRGGHEDQLSARPGLDKFRIRSLTKLLNGGMLNDSQSKVTVNILAEKCTIYSMGCRKRGRIEEASYYEQLANRYTQTSVLSE